MFGMVLNKYDTVRTAFPFPLPCKTLVFQKINWFLMKKLRISKKLTLGYIFLKCLVMTTATLIQSRFWASVA